jgi:outer membrane protein assembly factor BamD
MTRNSLGLALLTILALIGCGRNPYDNPIATDSQQPDKVLFDQSINYIEKKRFDIARLQLQTLINTYPDSEYIAKAKLAIADSWYQQGGSSSLAQAEAEYDDFITFFPSMEESAEAQKRICEIHYDQMVKPDRDNTHAIRADQECRQLILQWPNSIFRKETEQKLRDVQEIIAEAEYRVGTYYTDKGSYRAGANRLQTLTEHYPLFSNSDDALWTLGGTYESMGEEYTEQMVDAYSRIVRDYPLSPYVDAAKSKLTELNRPIPTADPQRYELHEYNVGHREYKGFWAKSFGIFGSAPDVRMAAKIGEPASTTLMPATPPGIRASVGVGAIQPSADVGVQTIDGPSAIDTQPDARQNQPSTPQN